MIKRTLECPKEIGIVQVGRADDEEALHQVTIGRFQASAIRY